MHTPTPDALGQVGLRHNKGFILVPETPTLAERMRESGFGTAAFVSAFVLDHRFGLARGFDSYHDPIGDRRSGSAVVGFAERNAGEVVDAFLGWLAGAPDHFFAWVVGSPIHMPATTPPAGFSLGSPERLSEGESLAEHGETTHCYSLYDATQRVPMIWNGPGFRDGRAVPDVVRLADVAPTLLVMLGAAPLAETNGRDLRVVARGGEFSEPAYPETLATHFNYGWSALFSVRNEQWRYIRAAQPELYDLQTDRGELRNVVAEKPDVARELDAWIGALFRSIRANFAVNAGHFDAVEREICAALEAEPDRPDYLNILAIARGRRGDLATCGAADGAGRSEDRRRVAGRGRSVRVRTQFQHVGLGIATLEPGNHDRRWQMRSGAERNRGGVWVGSGVLVLDGLVAGATAARAATLPFAGSLSILLGSFGVGIPG